MCKIIHEEDIHIYLTLSNQYRAYIRGMANVQAWGYSRESALSALIRVMSSKDIPFDLERE